MYNRPVYFVANDKLEVALVKQGGSMLRIDPEHGQVVGLARWPERLPIIGWAWPWVRPRCALWIWPRPMAFW